MAEFKILFNGQRALVTGAGKGIGRAVAKGLQNCGANTFALSRNKDDLESLKVECPGINTVYCDVSDWASTISAVSSVLPIDLLVNNAGISGLEPFGMITPETFNNIFGINVRGLINVSQVVTNNMRQRQVPGVVVNMSSNASMTALEDHTVYCASKSAVDSITRTMSLELGPHQIRVNSVNPTVVMTAMGKKFWGKGERTDAMLAKIPMGRFAEEKDVVNAVLYLLSDKADMINGVALPIDGGFLAS